MSTAPATLPLRIGYDVIFEASGATPMLLMLYVHPSREHQLREPEVIHIEPSVPISEFIDGFGNRVARIMAPAGHVRIWSESILEDSGEPDPLKPDARQLRIEDLPADVLPFLLSSRYCEADRLSSVAWDLFGKTPPGWARVQAVCDWVHRNIEFGYRHARNSKTAVDVYTERCGVCRDFMHLAVAFCRGLNIPARYATGYLSDVNAPPDPTPMDFSAYFEAYLDGQWWVFDARHNTPRYGRVLMARGRDAVDVPLTTSFGTVRLVKFKVITEPATAAPVQPELRMAS